MSRPIELKPFYEGWADQQRKLLETLRPLTSEQMQLRPAPTEWAIWQLASNMAGGRTYWLCFMLHEDDRGRARREVERVIAERAQYDIEYRVDRPGDSQVWVGVLGRAVYDADKVVGMYGVVQDITDRKRLEESLRASEARFRGLMEQAPFSVQVFSADGRTVRVNRAWEELWGVTRDQIADYNVLEDRQLELDP